MSVAAVLAVVAVVPAVLCWLGAIAGRRQGWTVAGTTLGAIAVTIEAVRRPAGDRGWALPAAVALVVTGEFVRLAVDGRTRGSRLRREAGVRRATAAAVAVVAGIAALAWAVSRVVSDGPMPSGLLVVAAVWVAAVAGAAAWAVTRLGRGRQAARRPVATAGATFAGLLAGAVVLAAASGAELRTGGSTATPTGGSVAATAVTDPPPSLPEAPPSPFTLPDDPGRLSFWISMAVLVLIIVVIIVFGRYEQILPPDDLQPDRLVRGGLDEVSAEPTAVRTLDRQVALATVEEALVGLRSDTDPRAAVRIAYATVAHGFGRQELGRRPAESEGEYLRRVLQPLGAGAGALGRLTELFTAARFGTDPVDEAMRSEALDALDEIRRQVGDRS